jgi:hypothetical protein
MIKIIANKLTSIGVLVSVIPVIDGAGALAWVGLVYSRMAAVAVGVVAHQAVAAVPAAASIIVGPWLIGIGASCAA